MNYVHIVALLAVVQFIVFSTLVGAARGKYGIAAPAMTGNEHFERAVRVQMNTLEQLVGFLPALFIAAAYWPQGSCSGQAAMRYLPMVTGISFVVVVKIIKNRKQTLACPHAEGPFLSPRSSVHRGPEQGTRHGRGIVNRGIKPLCREMDSVVAFEGPD